ncbi:hypothetical protein [Vibrio sp. D431a]|uniref:hypothetical protein n=1 Tax=Vibrio sp. D431a TaxID=2837388 RepID=UPI002553EB3C|nr:hypothetical protein [Vibrio sp. D431a]MDK9789811.1 hypothetical protein [Vibrio sp. D431a]
MHTNLADTLLSIADFGSYVVREDGGAEHCIGGSLESILKPIYFATERDKVVEHVPMEINVNHRTKEVSVEHPYALNINELETKVKQVYFGSELTKGFRVIGNKLPTHQRYLPHDYWYRLTVCKCPPPHMTPARGKVKHKFERELNLINKQRGSRHG